MTRPQKDPGRDVNVVKHAKGSRVLSLAVALRFPSVFAAIALLGSATLALAVIAALTIDREAALLMDGAVVHVTGLTQCTEGDSAALSVTVIQPRGSLLNSGTGSTNFVCDGTVQVWEVLVSTVAGSYQNGPATAIASMFTSGPDDTDDVSVSRRIHLHK